MKRFEITNLVLENIKTYEYEEIDFSKGNNVLIGENGAGKSTILESIYLSLFGEKVTGRTLGEMIRFGERQGKITIKFNVDNNTYRIVDELTRTDIDSNTGTQSQVLVNETLEETIAEGKTAVQIKMEEILGVDATTFSSAIYASQGEIGKIVTSTAKERKKLFDRLFQIDRFEYAWSNLAKVKKKVESTQEKLEIQIGNLRTDLEKLPGLKEQITAKEKQLREEKELLAAKEKQYEVIDEQYNKLNNLLSEYNTLEGEYNSAKDNVERLNKTIEDQIKNLKKVLKKKDELTPSIDKVKKLQAELKNDLQKLETSLDNLREEETKTNVVMQNISNTKERYDDLSQNIIEREKQLNNEITDFCEKISGLSNDIDLWSKELPDFLATIEKNKEEKEKEKKKLNKLSQKISDVNGQLKIHEESSSSIHTKIVKKRLNLAKEAGDDWQEKIESFAKIDFPTKIEEIKGTIITEEKVRTDLIGKKEGIEAALTRIKNDLNHLANLEGEETCPTCKQSLSEETLTELSKTLKKEKSEKIKKRKSCRKELKNIKNSLSNLKEDLDELEDKQKLYEKIKQTFDGLKELEKEKELLENKIAELKNKLTDLQKQFSSEKESQLENEINVLEKTIFNIKQAKEKIPQLTKNKQQIAEDKKRKVALTKKLKKLRDSITERPLEEIKQEKEKLESQEALFEKNLEELRLLRNRLADLNEDKSKLIKAENELKEIAKRQEYKEKEKIKSTWINLREEISSGKTKIKDLHEEVLPNLIEHKNNLIEKQKKSASLENELVLENDKIEFIAILRDLMRELPNRLLPNFIERVNHTASDILQSIIPGSDIQQIVVNSDYSINVVRLGNFEDISVLSGGETIIVALALRLAFAKEFSSLDSLILDEPTIFLDERRRSELVSVLEKKRLVGQMFVVTHDPDFERIADKTYHITKVRGKSTVKTIDDEAQRNDISILVE